jgi:hypothetical protein
MHNHHNHHHHHHPTHTHNTHTRAHNRTHHQVPLNLIVNNTIAKLNDGKLPTAAGDWVKLAGNAGNIMASSMPAFVQTALEGVLQSINVNGQPLVELPAVKAATQDPASMVKALPQLLNITLAGLEMGQVQEVAEQLHIKLPALDPKVKSSMEELKKIPQLLQVRAERGLLLRCACRCAAARWLAAARRASRAGLAALPLPCAPSHPPTPPAPTNAPSTPHAAPTGAQGRPDDRGPHEAAPDAGAGCRDGHDRCRRVCQAAAGRAGERRSTASAAAPIAPGASCALLLVRVPSLSDVCTHNPPAHPPPQTHTHTAAQAGGVL